MVLIIGIGLNVVLTELELTFSGDPEPLIS